MAPRKITIKGRIGSVVDGDGLVEYIAAAPPDSRASFSGSGMPFANPVQAFENTPTKGTFLAAKLTNEFDLTIEEPNSYYIGLGTTLIVPSIYIRYTSGGEVKTERLTIGRPIAYRTLTYQTATESIPRTGADFYQMSTEVDARTQEQIINDSAYTGKYQDKFWGVTPPV